MKAKKVDSNQSQIVQSLRDAGVQVVLLSDAGRDRPDLLLCWREWVLCELKDEQGTVSRGQLWFLANARGHIGIATDFDTAFAMAKKPQEFCLSQQQKDKLAAYLQTWEGEAISFRKLTRELL